MDNFCRKGAAFADSGNVSSPFRFRQMPVTRLLARRQANYD